ncbi:MAG: aminodeoxychorismate synthase component I [Candidatus Alcyoniella australis]|nr:aminodeoxychorismate synthase component I [Candidatus Alcyoniella australis]
MSPRIDALLRGVFSAGLAIHEVGLMLEPEEAFGRICRRPGSFFLDSSLSAGPHSGLSFIGCDPAALLTADGSGARLHNDSGILAQSDNPFELLRALTRRFDAQRVSDQIPFCGGLVGYLGYELGGWIERLPLTRMDDMAVPWMCLGLYPEVLAVDHDSGHWHLVGPGADPQHSTLLERVVGGRSSLPDPALPRLAADRPHVLWNFTQEQYLDAVAAALHYIREGEIYQVNISQRLEAPLLEHPWHVYSRLRRINPAPFSCYLNMPDAVICSSSPERFLKVDGRQVQTRPIKGTRPRGSDPLSDELLRDELAASAKDRAELAMIVDLERNDLGRVCEYGSVRVVEHAAIEEYATVFHSVSTVEGTLRPDVDLVDLLLATFPGGSISGAPKIRAMQIIDELEPTLRGPYTGSIGYLGFDGRADLNIAIRTMVIADDKIYAQVGGAIVADSEPQAEFDETLDKAAALIQTIERVGR